MQWIRRIPSPEGKAEGVGTQSLLLGLYGKVGRHTKGYLSQNGPSLPRLVLLQGSRISPLHCPGFLRVWTPSLTEMWAPPFVVVGNAEDLCVQRVIHSHKGLESRRMGLSSLSSDTWGHCTCVVCYLVTYESTTVSTIPWTGGALHSPCRVKEWVKEWVWKCPRRRRGGAL